MRKFYLVNESNQRYDLQSLADYAYMTEPNGLGYDNGLSYIKIGNGFKAESRELRQGFITGSITFDGYDKYQEFVNYVESSESLRLIYTPFDREYFRDVDFDSIAKSEKSGAWLQCSIKLNCKSLYYLEDTQEYVKESSTDTFKFPILFGSKFNDYAMILFDFLNEGHTEADIIAEIHGYIQNPVIELFVNGALKSRMIFDITVQAGQVLLYSAKSRDNYVILQDVDGTQTNIMDFLTLENDNFFKMPKGVSSLKITSDSGTSNRNVIRLLTYYKGV